MSKKHSLRQWAEDNGVQGIRFLPLNPSQSSPSEILDGAYKAIQALEAGRVVAYVDDVNNQTHVD